MTAHISGDQPGDGSAEVVVDGDCLLVTRLRLCDADLTRFVAEREEAERPLLVERALQVGLIALRNAGVTVNVDYVQKEFVRLLGQVAEVHRRAEEAVDRSLREAFADDSGRLPRTLERFLGERGSLPRLVDELFDEERRDSAIGRIRTLLEGYFDGDGAVLARLLDPDREGSPMHGFRDEVREGLDKLAERLTRLEVGSSARAAERAKGTAKGTDFEDVVEQRLGILAGGLGDLVERTSTTAGDALHAKKGDFVLEVDPGASGGCPARVAIEAKDRHLSLPEIVREIEAAKDNRRAPVALLVFSPGHAPSGTAPLTLHGGDVLCELDPEDPDDPGFDAAVRLARSLAIAAARQRDGEAIDVEAVGRNLDALRLRVDAVKGMRTNVTDIGRLAAQLGADLDGLRAELLASIAAIEAAVRVDQPSSPAPATAGSQAVPDTGAD
jgi:hypothetical protein